jgi:hypothetical protein
VGVLVVVIIAGFISRGWVRTTFIPKTAGLYYVNKVQSMTEIQNTDLQLPFNKLGFSTISNHSTCSLEIAQSISTQIDCYSNKQSYTKLPNNSIGKINLESSAQTLQTLLKTKGWTGGSNGVTLTSLIDGTYQGRDYSPDAYYEKVVGDYDCVFDTMIAYSNPQPPAINSSLSCDRTVNIFGTPKGEFYNSSKGHF